MDTCLACAYRYFHTAAPDETVVAQCRAAVADVLSHAIGSGVICDSSLSVNQFGLYAFFSDS